MTDATSRADISALLVEAAEEARIKSTASPPATLSLYFSLSISLSLSLYASLSLSILLSLSLYFSLSLYLSLSLSTSLSLSIDFSQGQKRYPKELLRQRFRVNFLVRFASKPLFYWVFCPRDAKCSENSLVLFVRCFGFVVLFWLVILSLYTNAATIPSSGHKCTILIPAHLVVSAPQIASVSKDPSGKMEPFCAFHLTPSLLSPSHFPIPNG